MASIRPFDTRVGHLRQFGHGYARVYVLADHHPLHSPLERFIDIPFEYADAMHNAERCEVIRRDISHRLRRVCADLTAADFLLLVNSMVAMQVKGELRKNRFFGPH